MNLNDFGKELKYKPEKAQNAESVPTLSEGKIDTNPLTQWAISGPDAYVGVSKTAKKLPAGSYTLKSINGHIEFWGVDTKNDNLIELPDSLHKRVLDEIEDFWLRGDRFIEYGFLHRRGYLLYGPAGGGKTCLVQQVVANIVKSGDVVVLCQHPKMMVEGLSNFRQIEPDRRVVCVFEDIDSIIAGYGEDCLLSLLDGEHQINKVLNIATTNYPERLDKRLVARPRRFDRVIKIGMPSEVVRKEYLSRKLKVNGTELLEWVTKTNGFSFAALAELVISVKCLGNRFEDALEILKTMSTQKVSSNEFDCLIGIRP